MEEYKKLKEEYNTIERAIYQYKDNILCNKSTYFTGVAFISFDKMKDKDDVVDNAHLSAWSWFFRGCKYKLRYKSPGIAETPLLRVQEAPEPAEILWENLKYGFKLQTKMKLLNVFVAGFILACSLLMMFGLKYASYKIKKKYKGDVITVTNPNGTKYEKYRDLTSSEDGQLQIISIMIFALAKVVNKIIDAVVAKLAILERNHTKSALYTSASNKIVMSQFLNTSVLITIVHYLLKGDDRYVIWGSGSLLVDIWYLVVFYSMVLPGFYIVNIPIIVNAIKKCRLKRNKDSKRYTQKQAHKICEGVPMDPVKAYTDIYQIFLVCMFFAPAFPMGVGLLICSLILVYWVQRLYLLRFHRRPDMLQSDLCFDSLIFIKIGGFVLTMGELYFDIVLRGTGDLSAILITQAVISFALIWIPIEDSFLNVYSYTGDEAEIKSNLTFEECKKSMELDYARANPVTSESALLSHIKLITQLSSIKRGMLRKRSSKWDLKRDSKVKLNLFDGKPNKLSAGKSNDDVDERWVLENISEENREGEINTRQVSFEQKKPFIDNDTEMQKLMKAEGLKRVSQLTEEQTKKPLDTILRPKIKLPKSLDEKSKVKRVNVKLRASKIGN